MPTNKTTMALVMGAVALCGLSGRPSLAAVPIAGIIGHHASALPDCPNVEWRLARHDDGRVTGIFWYSDLSGTSEAVGNIDKTGIFHVKLESAMG